MKIIHPKIYENHKIINGLINKSASKNKGNLKKVIRILRRFDCYFVFFINISIDFMIGSLDRVIIIDFFDKYTPIDIMKPLDEIEKEFRLQLTKHFLRKDFVLKSKFNFQPEGKHINVISYDKLWHNHLKEEADKTGISEEKLFTEPEEQVDLITFSLGIEKAIKCPFRNRIQDGVRTKTVMWLAKYNELFNVIDDYCLKKGEDKKYVEATAANDILGLGITHPNYATSISETVLFYIVFPETFKQKCFKPTFIDGPLWDCLNPLFESAQNSFFLNSEVNEKGYGLTRSTDKGDYATMECVSEGIDSLTKEFKLRVFSGKAKRIVDKSNMKENAIKRFGTI